MTSAVLTSPPFSSKLVRPVGRPPFAAVVAHNSPPRAPSSSAYRTPFLARARSGGAVTPGAHPSTAFDQQVPPFISGVHSYKKGKKVEGAR